MRDPVDVSLESCTMEEASPLQETDESDIHECEFYSGDIHECESQLLLTIQCFIEIKFCK